MRVFTDDPPFFSDWLEAPADFQQVPLVSLRPRLFVPLSRFFEGESVLEARTSSLLPCEALLAVREAPRSHFDVMAELLSERLELPTPWVCLAGSGSGFHGFHQRPWVGAMGNLHLVVLYRPESRLEQPGAAPLILATRALVETLEELEGLQGRVSIKWVNDVLIDGAKVAGVLGRTISQGEVTRYLLLGIGLNIACTPNVPRDPHVPAVTSIQDALPGAEVSRARILSSLLHRLETHLRSLVEGEVASHLAFYRQRSSLLGQQVQMVSEGPGDAGRIVASGRVVEIGPDLALHLEGHSEGFRRGRVEKVAG